MTPRQKIIALIGLGLVLAIPIFRSVCYIVNERELAVLLQFGEPVASFGLAQAGALVVALRNDVVLFEPRNGARERVARIEHAKPGMRLNDGKVGPDGAFWVGSMDASGDGAPAARLYRVGPDGSVRVVAEVQLNLEDLFVALTAEPLEAAA